MSTPSPRKRGAQPGNHNALKHGFYSKSFSSLEIHDLEAVSPLDLTDEIAMLRVGLRRYFEMIKGEADPGEARKVLAILGLSAGRLATLLKTQKQLQDSGGGDAASALSEALMNIIEEFHVE